MSTKAWLEEEEKRLIYLYTQVTDDIQEIGEEFPAKSYRSIISKLVQLKLYKKPEKEQSAEKTKTVKIMLRDLEKMLGVKIETSNLNKKDNLKVLVDAVEKLYNKTV